MEADSNIWWAPRGHHGDGLGQRGHGWGHCGREWGTAAKGGGLQP